MNHNIFLVFPTLYLLQDGFKAVGATWAGLRVVKTGSTRLLLFIESLVGFLIMRDVWKLLITKGGDWQWRSLPFAIQLSFFVFLG